MDATERSDEREIRAARNQALFRAVNERIKDVHQGWRDQGGELMIACECADTSCIEIVVIAPDAYERIRANPRQFAVRPGHVYPDVETVTSETREYAVVEMTGEGGTVAEALANAENPH